jgi:hypothetical protein
MEENSSLSASDPKPEATRAGGPDDTRDADESKEAPPEEPADTPRGAPEDTRSA